MAERANTWKLVDGQWEQVQLKDTSAEPAFIMLINVCESEWYFHTLHGYLLKKNLCVCISVAVCLNKTPQTL